MLSTVLTPTPLAVSEWEGECIPNRSVLIPLGPEPGWTGIPAQHERQMSEIVTDCSIV